MYKSHTHWNMLARVCMGIKEFIFKWNKYALHSEGMFFVNIQDIIEYFVAIYMLLLKIRHRHSGGQNNALKIKETVDFQMGFFKA